MAMLHSVDAVSKEGTVSRQKARQENPDLYHMLNL